MKRHRVYGLIFCVATIAFLAWVTPQGGALGAGALLPVLLMASCCVLPMVFAGSMQKGGHSCCGSKKKNEEKPESETTPSGRSPCH